MKIKINYKKIVLVLAIILVSCFILNGVQAAVTSNSGTVVKDNTSKAGSIINGFMDVLTYIGNMTASGVFATITALINVLSIAMFLILYTVLSMGTGDYTHIPMPDTIVFNRFAFFDPNFINPSTGSLVKGFGNILSNLYASFYTIAMAILIIAAMITGIKMALSSVASKKAQYKEAALKWVSGFLVLICLRWIIAGIFYINETIVATLYGITKSSDITIPIYVTDAIPIFGKLLSDLIKGLESLTGWDLKWHIPGYLGIVVANLCKSIGGNIISSIISFIIMRTDVNNSWFIFKKNFYVYIAGNNISFDSSSGYINLFYWEKNRNFY